MKRITSVILTLSVVLAHASQAQAVNPNGRRRAAPARQPLQLRQPRQPSVVLPRLERAPDGRINDRRFQRDLQARDLQARDLPARGRQNSAAAKPPHNFARDGGRYTKDAWKRGAGEWPKTDPKLASGGRKKVGPKTSPKEVRKGAPRTRLAEKGVRAADRVEAAFETARAIDNWQRLDADLRAGRITQAEYDRAQATNVVNSAGALLAIKNVNPASAAANALVGTDPLGLGVDAVGDLINGTNNAEKSIAEVGRRLGQHGKGVEKLVTNPQGWAKDTERNVNKELKKAEKSVNKAAKDVSKSVNQAGKDVDKFFKGVFGG